MRLGNRKSSGLRVEIGAHNGGRGGRISASGKSLRSDRSGKYEAAGKRGRLSDARAHDEVQQRTWVEEKCSGASIAQRRRVSPSPGGFGMA